MISESSRPASSTQQAPEPQGLHRETLSPKTSKHHNKQFEDERPGSHVVVSRGKSMAVITWVCLVTVIRPWWWLHPYLSKSRSR